MTKFERNIFILINLVVSIIGILYFFYDFFLKVETPFGLRPHPQTSSLLHLHIITVPLLLIMFGILWKGHIYSKLKSDHKERKRSGVAILILFSLMCLSGYMLQLALGVSIDQNLGLFHTALSLCWLIFSLWHCRFKFAQFRCIKK